MCTTATPLFSGNLAGEQLHSLPFPGLYASHAISVPICAKPIAVVDLFLLFTPVSLQFLMPRPRLPLVALGLAFSSRVQVRFVLCTFSCFVLFMFFLPSKKGADSAGKLLGLAPEPSRSGPTLESQSYSAVGVA